MRLGPTTANLIRKVPAGATVDRYGTPLDEAHPDDPTPIEGCRLDITSSREELEDRDTIISRGTLFVPYDETLILDGLDAFDIDGDIWEVEGNPDLTDSHLGPHHYEITLIHYHY